MSSAFVVPRTVDEAVAALGVDGAVPVAGGVALGVLVNLELADPERLVSLARIEQLRGVRDDGDEIVLGATATHTELAASPVLRTRIPALAEMFGHIGNVRVRAWGTVGGNLALAEPSQDPPVFLSALGASVLLSGAGGTRRVPVADFATGPMLTVLEPAELITGVSVPAQGRGEHCAYHKFLPRTADDYATVSAGVWLRVDLDGRIERVHLSCGAVGSVVVDCADAAGLLVGRHRDDPDLLDGVAAAVREAVSPISDHRGSAEYKRTVAGVFAERSIRSVLGRDRQQERGGR